VQCNTHFGAEPIAGGQRRRRTEGAAPMARIPESFIDELLARVDIVDVDRALRAAQEGGH
jgi:hypothetical protein